MSAPGAGTASSDFERFTRATVNLLEDAAAEKSRLEGALRAAFNILEDFAEEKRRLEDNQRAVLNILEDAARERLTLEDSQKAALNILEDAAVEKGRLEEMQRALLNILDDVDVQRASVERTNRILSEEVERRWRTEGELKAHAEALARSNAELEQFAYVASHDLQEPLRKIQSYCQLLERRYKDELDERGKTYINFVVDGSERMQNLVRDLLAFARVRSAAKPLQPTDAGASLQEALGYLETPIQEADAEVRAAPLPLVNADPSQMTQVFQNLISNAIKFRRPDAKPVIDVRAHLEGHLWHFVVRDNGIGIEPAHLERVFVIFQRLHGRGEYPGTGIGLAICKRVIERFGGRIWVESTPGEGSAFHFTVPALKEEGA